MRDVGFADPGTNSFNHAAFGCVATWLHERLAGLAPGRPGWELMRVRPRPAGGLFEPGPRELRVDRRARVAAQPIIVGWGRHVVEGVR